MTQLALEQLDPSIAHKLMPFLQDVLNAYPENLHSIHIVGSALSADYRNNRTDINSIFVLHRMDLSFLSILAPLGKRVRKKRIAAPLIMTPEYINSSTDVFPIEFLNFKLLHKTVYGEDILESLEIRISDLRQQCERELKANLIGLRQGYLSSLGDAQDLINRMLASLPASLPLFRGILLLTGEDPPVEAELVLERLGAATNIDCGVFMDLMKAEDKIKKSSRDLARNLFHNVYMSTEKLSHLVDQITV